jgi:hypothetical protein
MSQSGTKTTTTTPRNTQAEVRQIRAAARQIASSKAASTRFLASTGMHRRNGQVKSRFR